MLKLAASFPNSRFRGIDLSKEATDHANKAASDAGLDNVTFAEAELSAMDRFGAFDLITAFDAGHDQKDPQGLLDAVARSLNPDGLFLMQMVAGRAIWRRTPIIRWGRFSMPSRPCTARRSRSRKAARGWVPCGARKWPQRCSRKAGFANVSIERLQHDPINVYYLARV